MNNGIEAAQAKAKAIVDNIEQVIVGKRDKVELAVIALISQGHVLLEDIPGVGKTMLARSLAKSLDCSFKRIQFTPDMLPSDIIGVSIYNQKTSDFEFHPGPVMAQIVLADEINRGTSKLQSALLECMEERQITIDGVTHEMPNPFHILATQSPIEYESTVPLPETQLDRFLMRISLGYPSGSDEIIIIDSQRYHHPVKTLQAVATSDDVEMLQMVVKDVYIDDLVKQYIVDLARATRSHPAIVLGASPRASLALYRTAQAKALINGRDYVLPDDVKTLAEPVLAHRIIVGMTDSSRDKSGRDVVAQILESVPVPYTSTK
jgi:MoxR-like ATPase